MAKSGFMDNLFDDLDENDILEFEKYLKADMKISCDGLIGWCPSVDMYETASELVLIFDVAYASVANIQIEILEKTIVFSGKREKLNVDEKKHYFKMEIDSGPFKRTISLPVKVKKEFKLNNYNGLLEIRLSKVN